jgi:endonuclease/exonuclease/phosphatase family metal-dependent hydrolase
METETKQRHSETNRSYEQMNLTGIYRTFHPKAKEYTFSAPHGTFCKIDHIIVHKTGLNRYRKIEIIPCTLSDHNRLRLVLN